jgi:hypothetical protein
MLEGGRDPGRQLDFAFRVCLARLPSKGEHQRLLEFYQQQANSFIRDPRSAEALLNAGTAGGASGLDTSKLAAWMMVANVLLNLDETVTKG